MGKEFLNLGLFIILLSFFLVLNGGTSYEDKKSRIVIDSLYGAFSHDFVLRPTIFTASPVQDVRSQDAGATLEQIEAVFRKIFPEMIFEGERFGAALRLDVPRDVFEDMLYGDGEYGRAFALMAASLSGDARNRAVVMDVTLRSAAAQGLVDVSGGYAAALQGFGVRPQYFSVGLEHAGWLDRDMVRLSFSPYEKLELRLSRYPELFYQQYQSDEGAL